MFASWMTHRVQSADKNRTESRNARASLYWEFIEEASKLYADAFQREEGDLAKLVRLYALLNRMQIVSSPDVIAKADRTARAIVATYLSPNLTFAEVGRLADADAENPLRDFSVACRRELHGGRDG